MAQTELAARLVQGVLAITIQPVAQLDNLALARRQTRQQVPDLRFQCLRDHHPFRRIDRIVLQQIAERKLVLANSAPYIQAERLLSLVHYQ